MKKARRINESTFLSTDTRHFLRVKSAYLTDFLTVLTSAMMASRDGEKAWGAFARPCQIFCEK
jgi:hypothetical protein